MIRVMQIDEALIRRAARARLEGLSLGAIVVRQAYHEGRFRWRKRLSIRAPGNASAVSAYSRMEMREFAEVNLRQRWANWRTIPRNLSGLLPDRPLRAIDLGCGIGDSTEVLAYYLAPGSEILGLECNAAFVSRATRRAYLLHDGSEARARFLVQSVLERFLDVDGTEVPCASVDLVNSSGVVGHHLVPGDSERLADEVARVLRVGGLALIDSGRAGTPKKELIRIFRARGFSVLRSARSCLLDPYEQVCFLK